MNEPENTKTSKREYWQDQIEKWQESNLSQSAFCKQSGVKLSTFMYWRSVLSPLENKKMPIFAPLKIIKNEITHEMDAKIEIKLITGHVVYLPTTIGIHEITKLIHSLGVPHV
jgi:hypothetical protein